jgi:hypothetical protein
MQLKLKLVTTMAAIAFSTAISVTSFSQTSRFSLSVNSLTTNFNYGDGNRSLQSYKKNFRGLQAGVSYQAGVSPAFSIVPELYFAIKGGVLKEHNPLTTGKSTLRINSLEMPVLARLHLNKLYINAGPYVGYNVGGRMKIEATEHTAETSEKISFGGGSNDFRRWDFGLLAGAGYNFNIKKTILTLDARYGYGLINMSKDVERYNRVLNISLAISTPHSKNQSEKQE